VPLLNDYELFRSRQKIMAQDPSATDRPMRKMTIAPCSATCPANICVQGYIGLVASRRYSEALRLIRDRIPFPSICGSVCPHPCKDVCVRGDYDEPLAINDLKLFVAERETEAERAEYVQSLKSKIIKKGKHVAVVGAGPAGLTCAHDLALRGYDVTVFEALERPGGMMAVGIPHYRLPRPTLNREIDLIEHLGVQIVTGIRVGQDISLKELFARGYEAIFIGTGAYVGLKLGIEGEECAGVLDALSFLKRINLDEESIQVGRRVAVIGGGDAAIDAARSALRLGAEHVQLLYRRTREEMPAYAHEVKQAEAEGVHFSWLTAPVKFMGDGHLKSVECTYMKLGVPDESGRPRAEPVPGTEFALDVDTVILAIGQGPRAEFLQAIEGLEVEHRLVKINEHYQTTNERYFAGGDCTNGGGTAVEAVQHGKLAAQGIHEYVMSQHIAPARKRRERR
jgi:NADPH-dependent glutamate synthase beta subunit-like oxidoreductase